VPFSTRTARTALIASLLVLAAACGTTGDGDADSTTSTTAAERSTTTTEAETTTTEVEETTTTEADDGGTGGNDPELEALLLEADEFGDDVTEDDDETEPFEAEACEGQEYTVEPDAQAAIGVTSDDLSIFAGEAIAQFGSDDDASTFLTEIQDLNAACLEQDEDSAIPATFEPVGDLGDEAYRAVTDPTSEYANYEMIIARVGDRAVLLFALGDEQVLTNDLILTAVERAAG
jgi:hypothetical protein